MWPYNESENAFVGGMTGSKSTLDRMTPGEIELMARKMRAMIIADALATTVLTVSRAIGWLARPLVAWWNRTQVYDELMSMDDRMLADIGISRAEIPAVAAGHYRADTGSRAWRGIDRVRRMTHATLPLAHNDQTAPPQVA
jgi:uncharacterized protein YjiS (DUF1127 family)